MKGRYRGSFEPSTFNDPVAMETSWYPLKSGSANFRIRKLEAINSARMEFKVTIEAKLFCLILVITGMSLLSVPQKIGFLPLLACFAFSSVGAGMLYFASAPIVFDLGQGVFWKGRKAPDQFLHENQLKYFAKIKDIHALQLISEKIYSNRAYFYNYELNLVLKNGKRIKVVDHGNLNKIRADTSKLSRFLNKPIWDVI